MPDTDKNQNLIAHVRQNKHGQFIIHEINEHLEAVAALASQQASKFGSADWAYLAGLWHDLGKYSQAFQHRIKTLSGFDAEAHLEGKAGKVDHSTAGAQYAIEQLGVSGRILAYLIAGHHTGLPDWHTGDAKGLALKVRLDEPSHLERVLSQNIPQTIFAQSKPTSSLLGGSEGFALWVRMLFSTLVDADFLDTEQFMDEDRAAHRKNTVAIKTLLQQFNTHMDEKFSNRKNTKVNSVRTEVLQQCREQAHKPSGIFSLTVPTGGGKTLSSLAFALGHADTHNKKRVIYVIPYTSIIEQTANTFREIFSDAVLEHHSNLDPDKETTVKNRLAAENWDAPIIVTTNVQFFESLFAAKTSRCRKLHNIVNSVVVLDEAQLLPPEFLKPILKVMNLLTKYYGVTFVLSTATQPALNKRSGFDWDFPGLENVTEIINHPEALYRDLDRVKVDLPKDFQEPETWDDIAEQVQKHKSVLAIVNSRSDARELHRRLPEGTLHLSALMCGEHRSRVIEDIKQRLNDGKSLRVVSTQLVESGVDIDFPVVFRALAGLDSIAQAAGRCNREGKPSLGKVVVFVPPKPPPPGYLRRAAQTTISILSGESGNPLQRGHFKNYFEQLYWKAPSLDQHGIEKLLRPEGDADDCLKVQFRTAAQRFQLIDESGYRSLIVRYAKSPGLIGQLQKQGPERWLMRKLQRYTVSLPEYQFQTLLNQNDISEVYPGLFAQTANALYHPVLGVLLGETNFDPSALFEG